MTRGKNVRLTDRLISSDFNRSGFVVRTRTPIQAVSRFLAILTMATMGVAVSLYYNDSRGAILAVGVGSIVIYIGRKLERQELIQESTEFMNALFSSALGDGYCFCTVIRQDGEVVYLNRAFQAMFPAFIDQPKRDLASFFTLYDVPAEEHQKILAFITDGVEGNVAIRISGAGDAALQHLTLCIKPITGPAGFVLLRGSSMVPSCRCEQGNKGFTLVELAIVLVIIGLIIGGVLVGQDLIHQAQLRKVITQTEQFITAVNTFRGKYNCLPGDCANASSLISGAVNGNGDEQITYYAGPNWPINESVNMWSQLSQAGLIAGNYPADNGTGTYAGADFPLSAVPVSPISSSSYYIVRNMYTWATLNGIPFNTYGWTAGGVPASTAPTNSSWLMLSNFSTPDSRVLSGAMTGVDVQSIDIKVDDGMPFTGRIAGSDTSNTCVNGIWTTDYSTSTYITNNTHTDCLLMRLLPQ